jgi:hypothetical protein
MTAFAPPGRRCGGRFPRLIKTNNTDRALRRAQRALVRSDAHPQG